MGNFTISEILTIAVVILIVFGPNRLPELARKAGNLLARARGTVQSLREEFSTEYEQVVAPMRDVRDELKAVRQDLDETVTEFAKDVKNAGDVSEELDTIKDDVEGTVTDIAKEVQAVGAPVDAAVVDPNGPVGDLADDRDDGAKTPPTAPVDHDPTRDLETDRPHGSPDEPGSMPPAEPAKPSPAEEATGTEGS